MKTCRKCGVEKPILDFGVSGKNNGLHKNKCKICCAASLKEWRQQNPERAKARDRAWAAKNRSKISEKNKKRYNNPSLEKKLQMLLKTAADRKIGFNLSLDDLKDIWDKQNGLCTYTGLPLTPKGHQINTVSLDRIDSNGIYEKSNVQLVCVVINRMKLDYSENNFIQLCRLVTQHNKDKEYLVELAITV